MVRRCSISAGDVRGEPVDHLRLFRPPDRGVDHQRLHRAQLLEAGQRGDALDQGQVVGICIGITLLHRGLSRWRQHPLHKALRLLFERAGNLFADGQIGRQHRGRSRGGDAQTGHFVQEADGRRTLHHGGVDLAVLQRAQGHAIGGEDLEAVGLEAREKRLSRRIAQVLQQTSYQWISRAGDGRVVHAHLAAQRGLGQIVPGLGPVGRSDGLGVVEDDAGKGHTYRLPAVAERHELLAQRGVAHPGRPAALQQALRGKGLHGLVAVEPEHVPLRVAAFGLHPRQQRAGAQVNEVDRNAGGLGEGLRQMLVIAHGAIDGQGGGVCRAKGGGAKCGAAQQARQLVDERTGGD